MDRRSVILVSAVVLALLILTTSYDFFYSILGLVTSMNVTIEEEVMGRIYIELEEYLWIGERQSIFTEFSNIGSTNMTSRIEITIYYFDSPYLNKTAEYNDIYVFLHPGDRRSYDTNFIPPYEGLYFVKVRVPMDYRVMEQWERFRVYEPQYTTTTTTIRTGTTVGPAPGGVSPIYRNPQLRLEYPDMVEIYKNDTKMFNITAKNVGDAHLTDLKLSVSTSLRLEYSYSPKLVETLWMNNETIFLISVHVPADTPEGLYPFDFEFLSNELKREGTTYIEVPAEAIEEYLEEELWDQILNYELIITEIERDIIGAHLDGFDVGFANESLNYAKTNLDIAKAQYHAGEYEDVKDSLKRVREGLEDAVFRLANAMLYVYGPPAISPYLILAIVIILALIIFIIIFWYRRKKEKERPKLLRKSKQAPTQE